MAVIPNALTPAQVPRLRAMLTAVALLLPVMNGRDGFSDASALAE
jgi:hypothetical protein